MNRKMFRGIAMFILSLITCCCIALPNVFAQGPIDSGRDVTLTIHYQYEGDDVAEIPFDIYRVADVSEGSPVFALSGDFETAPVLLNDLDAEGWKIAAETLTGYAQNKGISPLCSAKTGSNGQVSFPTEGVSMKAGLYLAVSPQTRIENDVYTTQPFLVCIPGRNNAENTWEYSVTVYPKDLKRDTSEIPGVVERKVLKVWEDNGNESTRPKEITVYLLKDGERYDTVKLSKENNWRYTWNKLPGSGEWRVVESDVDGYTTTVTQEGITFVVTNKSKEDPPPEPPDPNIPQTGTTRHIVPILACAGLFFIVIGVWVRRREKRYEA